MTDVSAERVEEIFCAALELSSPDEREAFLRRACAGAAALRAAVDAMLVSQGDVEKFFGASPAPVSANALSRVLAEAPGADVGAAPICSAAEELGKHIGPYKLLQRIGEGGCGTVYMAEQESPVRRRVALKIIKLGMDTKNVMARFDAERQALALMDHPNIARVLDAGATETGRPYFVMELVRGVKFTIYCDEHCLDADQRLSLFIQVCHAIQHAHQKGVIHRDIKPSNILVTMHDGVPVPKVIDFGIAKATTGQLLTDKTLFTAYEQFVGTPAYMSPEQAEMSGLDVDTRSDIYSLGVLLYELLTGRTPFEPQELLRSGLDEMRRTLREREPHRPSTRLDALRREELTQTALHRHVEPRKLKTLLSGDLDWIVMKALEKDRRRRYQTANGLAMDVQRYLHSEPVVARPPSRLYRLQKLVRRNRVVFASGAIVALSLTSALALSTWLFFREKQARLAEMNLRREAEHAEANERQLRKEAEAREKVTEAAVLLSRNEMQPADQLAASIPPALLTPSTEAMGVFRALGAWHALRGEWQAAAERYAVLVQVNRVDKSDRTDAATRDLLLAAPLMIQARDIAGYDRLRRMELSRLGDTQNPIAAEQLIKISLLLPADAGLLRQLTPLADVIASSLTNSDPQINGGPFYQAWRAQALGLLAYRRGSFADAVKWQERCLSYPDPNQNQARITIAHILIGMACRGLLEPARADSELEEGREMVASHFRNGLVMGDDKTGQIQDWLIARLFLRQAESPAAGAVPHLSASRFGALPGQ